MFTFVQHSLALVAMATKIWEFQYKISCIWGCIRDITEHLCLCSNPKPQRTYAKRAVCKAHFKVNWAFKFILFIASMAQSDT